MIIEKMTVEHIDLVLPYEHEMFGPEAWTRGMYRDELLDTKHRWYVIALEEDGKLLGWAGLFSLYETAQILTVGVVPAAQRRGIGTELVRLLETGARHRKTTELLLEVRVDNEPAKALYQREGFVELGRRKGYYDNGRVDAITMRKELGDQQTPSVDIRPQRSVDHGGGTA